MFFFFFLWGFLLYSLIFVGVGAWVGMFWCVELVVVLMGLDMLGAFLNWMVYCSFWMGFGMVLHGQSHAGSKSQV